MLDFNANERTFQGVLLSLFNKLIDDNPEIKFDSTIQELNVGVGESRFSDTIITSSIDSKLKIFIELKNQSWDATDEDLVNDAMMKAFNRGIEYFVTGTPRQLVLFRTFKPNTTPQDCKLKLFRFFFEELELKGTKIILPENPADCEKILLILSNDFKKYGAQIKSVLKSLRSSASYLSVYRDLIF